MLKGSRKLLSLIRSRLALTLLQVTVNSKPMRFQNSISTSLPWLVSQQLPFEDLLKAEVSLPLFEP